MATFASDTRGKGVRILTLNVRRKATGSVGAVTPGTPVGDDHLAIGHSSVPVAIAVAIIPSVTIAAVGVVIFESRRDVIQKICQEKIESRAPHGREGLLHDLIQVSAAAARKNR